MLIRQLALAGVCLGIAAAAAAPTHAQQCTSSQDAAVECFAGDALKTGLLDNHHGLTTSQFKTYSVSVSRILQAQETNLILFGMSSAVADAMPATNANGTANQTAQTNAVNSIVAAELSSGIVTIPAEVNEQDMQWFSLDMVTSMDANNGILLSPGTLLRVIDSYIVAQTSGGSVNWTAVNTNLGVMVTNIATLGLLKLPAAITLAQVRTFAQSLAQIIYTYKVVTARTTL
jgi:hypothetical protein